MAMGTEIMAASVLAGVNILLLGGLTAVWVRNYRTFRTPLILGLIAFGSVMLLENAAAIYFFFSTKMLYSGDPGVQTAVVTLRALQFVALAFLAWVTAK
ncbi:hypothetical protein [Halostella litorea]|uniref:hypothetical protein n=1 Tax=Halostella litorea TaxID=2528831 RepID=UPI00109275E0|nr:hypothetical protein [Halostella litorea]